MEERIPLKERFQEKVQFDFQHFLGEETYAFLSLYSWKGWMFSCFSLFYIAVPVYLFKTSFIAFSAFSVLDLILGLLLLVFWVGFPALFVFYNSRNNKKKRLCAWGWVFAVVVFGVLWAMVLPV